MAKVTGPLMSLGGSGSIAKTLVVSRWKGRPYIRQHVVPANPNTVAQQNTRGLFANSQLLYKQSPDVARQPWQRFVQGQALTEWNAFTSKFILTNNGEIDLAKLVFSPGAKGGLAPIDLTLTGGALQIQADLTVPSPPTGWTLTAGQYACVEDGSPEALTIFDWHAGEDLVAPYSTVFSGLKAATTYSCGGWLKWAKPDGSTAFGASITKLEATT